MKARTTAIKGIGNVILGEMHIYTIQKVEDKGSYWNLVVNANTEVFVCKENWNLAIFADDKEYKKMLINECLEDVKRNPLRTKDLKEIKRELSKEHIRILEKMRGMRVCY